MANARVPVAAGNWKMNTTVSEGEQLCRELLDALGGFGGCEVLVFPPYTHLASLAKLLSGTRVGLGAQDLFWEPKGAFTGAVSAAMIRELARYVIIGHSERRQYFGETDQTVNRRLNAALDAGLAPVVCVGERLEERDTGRVEQVLERQVRGALVDITLPPAAMIAYEPVWAIGTGRAANGEQAEQAMRFIRDVVRREQGGEVADRTRLLYGGSVTPQNIAEFMAQPDVDGALVGGASLNAASFAEIARSIASARAS
ncbi:MAG TPA: triose-phosphate isomerase [Dehalococcoidia bacterium]|jgi:triosephosphate isomerase|nr:triose-phosphate isomerase [Dehalococcoidia bacterium]